MNVLALYQTTGVNININVRLFENVQSFKEITDKMNEAVSSHLEDVDWIQYVPMEYLQEELTYSVIASGA